LLAALHACSAEAGDGATLTKEVKFGAIRIRHDQLAGLVAKVQRIIKQANSQTGDEAVYQTLTLEANDDRLTMRGDEIRDSFPKLAPDEITSVTYRYETKAPAAISTVELRLLDSGRTLEVSGTSHDNVQMVVASVSEELQRLETVWFSVWMRLLLSLLLAGGVGYLSMRLFELGSRHRHVWLYNGISLVFFLAAMALSSSTTFPLLFRTFLSLRGDPSMLVRYGPLLTLVGAIPTFLAMGRWLIKLGQRGSLGTKVN
jgi:hypothetical protein